MCIFIAVLNCRITILAQSLTRLVARVVTSEGTFNGMYHTGYDFTLLQRPASAVAVTPLCAWQFYKTLPSNLIIRENVVCL